MSLLTDEEITGLQAQVLGKGFVDGVRPIVQAQHTKDLKAVAEWLEERCDKPDHRREGSQRGTCVSCVASLFASLREGKMPGEE